ncbi:hypothetical protein QQP08_025339 [Theobroma cacao]|nr:hypothetical protein QQP08_025339 [Theobroma cacao]
MLEYKWQRLPVGASISITVKNSTAIFVQDELLIKHSETKGSIIRNILGEDHTDPFAYSTTLSINSPWSIVFLSTITLVLRSLFEQNR